MPRALNNVVQVLLFLWFLCVASAVTMATINTTVLSHTAKIMAGEISNRTLESYDATLMMLCSVI